MEKIDYKMLLEFVEKYEGEATPGECAPERDRPGGKRNYSRLWTL